MKFEWDSKKEQDNIIKHGISFTTAQRAFFDPEFMERYDKKNSTQAEERWQIMGLFEDVSFRGVLFVVYTERGDYTRIISAREASPQERRIYYGDSETYGWYRDNS
jgi:uncharacterized DUF497 family protein